MQQRFTKLPYVLCYITAIVVGIKQLREPDMWWQLLSGRWMLENGAITRTDMFSYTVDGTSWTNVKWLYEVVAATLEKALGPHAVMLMQIVVNVLIVYLLFRVLSYVVQQVGGYISTFFTVLAAIFFLALSEFRMAGRPEMISHLMTVLFLFILWRNSKLSLKGLLWLIPLQCIWANMHEGYPVGIVIIGVYLVGAIIAYLLDKTKDNLQAVKNIGIVLVSSAVAILLNPNTIKLWTQPFEIFRQLKANKYTTELYSFTHPEYWTFQAKANVVVLLAVMLFWLFRLFIDKSNKLKLSPILLGYLISIPLFGYLSLSANRNIPFAQIVLFPSIPVMLLWLVNRFKLESKKWYGHLLGKTTIISAAVVALFYIAIVSNEYYKFTDVPNKYGIHINTLHNPTSAADFIKRHNLQGPAFSDYFVSSYLLWDLYPQFKSYIDLRDLDIFSEEFFDEYFELYTNPNKFYELDSTYKFNYVVLSTSQLSSVQQMLYWGSGFNMVYADPVSVIFLRETKENEALNRNIAIHRLFTWPQEPIDPGWAEALTKVFNPTVKYEEEDVERSPILAARFYNNVQNTKVAIKLLQPAVQTNLSDNAEALSTLGYSFVEYNRFAKSNEEMQAKIDSAYMFFQRSLDIDPNISSTHMGIASILMMRKRNHEAKEHMERCIELDDKNGFAFYMYGLACRNIWQSSRDKEELEQVKETMEHALELNEENEKALLYLAEANWHLGNKDEARGYLRKALDAQVYWVASEKELIDILKNLTGVE